MKRIYEKPEINIASFESEDIITLSSMEITLMKFNSQSFDNVFENY